MGSDELVLAIRELALEVRSLRLALSSPKEGPDPAPLATRPIEGGSSAGADRGRNDDDVLPGIAENQVVEEIRTLIAAMFAAALDEDEPSAFERFIDCMHSDRIDAPRSIPSLREFNWKSIRKNVARYLSTEGSVDSFTLERTIPSDPSEEAPSVKVFLACAGRSPVPITFKRDQAHDNALRVTDSSL